MFKRLDLFGINFFWGVLMVSLGVGALQNELKTLLLYVKNVNRGLIVLTHGNDIDGKWI